MGKKSTSFFAVIAAGKDLDKKGWGEFALAEHRMHPRIVAVEELRLSSSCSELVTFSGIFSKRSEDADGNEHLYGLSFLRLTPQDRL